MKKILKNVQPSIRAYLGLACCYSIIDEQAFNSGWVYDKYIHLEYTPYDSQIKYADYEHYDFVSAQGVFAKSFIEYPYDFCSETILCEYICKMLDEGEYCFALWNETIITNYLYEKQNPGIYEHGCFVYGYDRIRRCFIHKDILIMKTGNMHKSHLKFFTRLFHIARKRVKLP